MLHSLARPVKGRWLATPSETRLLAVVILAIVALVFISTLINPPHWLQVAALFGRFSLGPAGYIAIVAQIVLIATVTAITSRRTVDRTLESVE